VKIDLGIDRVGIDAEAIDQLETCPILDLRKLRQYRPDPSPSAFGKEDGP
jgi:hypothetical protein